MTCDKTSTERLQELLDERGVEHETMLLWDGVITKWTVGGYDWKADSGYSGDELICLSLDTLITPEQAVEVTLGRKRDERLAARMTDVMMRVERALGVDHGGAEVLSAEVAPLLSEALEIIDEAATMGRGECRNLSKYVNEFECSRCGWTYDFVSDPYSGPRYCPSCGRRVIE